jgi:DNA repair exonuclease SbcCD nuclease subunit
MVYKEVFLMGDVHGDFISVFRHFSKGKDMTNCLIIQVGDYGLGFSSKNTDEENLMHVNEVLLKAGCDCFVIRGNHDDPAFFQGNHQYSNLKLLPDYTYLKINEQTYLFAGGAVSIDRVSRKKRDEHPVNFLFDIKSYFYGEEFNFDPTKVTSEKVDVLVTHTAPSWCFPQNKNGFGSFVDSFIKTDKKLPDDLNKERADVDKMFNMVLKNGQISYHYYGHFHTTDTMSYNGCQHQLINQYTVIKHDNVSLK